MTTNKGRTPLVDQAAIIDTWRRLLADGQVSELRALEATTTSDRYPRTLTGYFNNAEALAAAVAAITTAKGVYVIPNPVNPDLLARASNRIKPAGKGELTQDGDILRRRWLLIDADPVRPTGISSTDAEHAAALQRVKDIAADLQAAGWPEPIIADSGNGAHALFRIDLRADDGGVVQRCLQTLAARFDDATVKVDQSVFNPARIWKLYGTMACKGDDVPGRPWRMGRILRAPRRLRAVPVKLLQALAADAPHPGPAAPRQDHATGERFDIDDFVRRHGLEVDGPSDWNGKQGSGRRWAFRKSPMCDHHDGAAHIEQHASGAVTAGCHHKSCSWTWQDLRARFDPKPNPACVRGYTRRGIGRNVRSYPAANGEGEADKPAELNQQGARLFAEIEPWPRPVDGKKLLADVEAYLRRYVVLPDDAGLVISAWCMAAWSIECWDRFPHLEFASPEKRCGKTRALQALEQICPRPLNTASISPAALYRAVEQHGPTLLIDEAQSLTRRGSESAEALRELLNAGIDKNAAVLRVGGPERDTLQKFAVFSPKVMALIGVLDAVLSDRCLTIGMARKTDADRVAPWRSRLVETQAGPLARRLARWTADNAERLAKEYDVTEPFPLRNDRLAELVLPLQAVAKVADRKKLTGLKRYAARLDAGDVETESPGVRLLAAIREVFRQSSDDFLPTADLVRALVKRPEEPWARCNHGRIITHEGLANLLRPFGVRPAHSRNRKTRGYYRADFETAWTLYLTPSRKSRPARPTRPGTGTRKPAKRTATDGKRRGKTCKGRGHCGRVGQVFQGE